MSDFNKSYNYNMPLTLETHFENLMRCVPSVRELYSLWNLLKKRIENELINSRSVFVNLSLHDGSHSRSIIHAIERFLGEERIRMLSATDTFMLLICAYTHDYGMAKTYNKIYSILGSDAFAEFLNDTQNHLQSLEKEEKEAVTNLLQHLNNSKPSLPLNEMYYSIMLVLQLYLRPSHWKGAQDIEKDFHGLFQGYMKNRFIYGSEGIIEICMSHGQTFSDLFKLSQRADGIIGDEFHPRFIAAMLRLGDLLDLDNDRFPIWFAKEAIQKPSMLPKLSILHFQKHEAVSHLLITSKKIEIYAKCDGEPEGYETASLVNEWTDNLKDECNQLVIHWNEIAQPDFGRPPSNLNIQILLNGKPYTSATKKMQMQMSQERVMTLLEGTSIYQDRYVGIREMIQNAVDASLLQLWYDILQNRYLSYGLSKNTKKSGLDLMDLTKNNRNAIFANYDISVEVVQDLHLKKVFVIVKDKGIGITPEDVQYISDIGSSRENNVRIQDLMKHMPKWLKPSGIFGIGLQSVFQLTDCIEFYTRQHNMPERCISLYSYGKSKGKIDIREMPESKDGLYHDNSVPGTNVKIAIEPRKIMKKGNEKSNSKGFIYYDPEFDLDEELDIIYAELGRVCAEKIKSVKCDYFNINYTAIKLNKDVPPGYNPENKTRCLRRSFFLTNSINKNADPVKFGDTIKPLFYGRPHPYHFDSNIAHYWDKTTCRFYSLQIRPCIISKEISNQVFLPETVPNLYHISYKFNTLSNAETIYLPGNHSRRRHAGFLDWDILILDDQPTNYLNIDRDRLREDAIHEEELLIVRKKILQKWCEYFCAPDSDKSKKSNRFKDSPGILLSLILLFYQNLPLEQFQKFITLYRTFIDSLNLVAGTEKIPITYFWDFTKLFQTTLELPVNFDALESEKAEEEVTEITLATLQHFPHRPVQIESIYNDCSNKLLYRFRFNILSDEIHPIIMSKAAKLYDYMQIFEPYTDQPKRVNFFAIQKKVFKPDRQYFHLIIPCYPHTFSKGRNFSTHLDYCIRWYILSPFDQTTANIIKEGIEQNKPNEKKLKEQVMSSTQMEKCVQYILKKRYLNSPEKESISKTIRQEYAAFVNDFFALLYQNRELVLEQFQFKKKNDYSE